MRMVWSWLDLIWAMMSMMSNHQQEARDIHKTLLIMCFEFF
jgi:hypothetical protein